MFTLKYRNENGWYEKSFDDEAQANAAYESFAEVYRFVTLTQTETVVNEVVVRDSTAA